MTLNEKVINYKFLGIINLYKLGVMLDFIRDDMKYLCMIICRGGSDHPCPENQY